MSKARANLEGLRVFVVEDEFAVLLMVEDMLGELGCRVAAAASRLNEALDMAGAVTSDVALLDVNINQEPVYPVAEILAARNVPIVFSTGYGKDGMDGRWRDRPVLQKPYRTEELAAALTSAIASTKSCA